MQKHATPIPEGQPQSTNADNNPKMQTNQHMQTNPEMQTTQNKPKMQNQSTHA